MYVRWKPFTLVCVPSTHLECKFLPVAHHRDYLAASWDSCSKSIHRLHHDFAAARMAIITFWLKLLHSTKKLTKQTLLRCCKFDRRCRNGFKISLSCKPNNTRLKQYYKRSQEHSWHARSPFTDLEDKTTLQDTLIVSTVSRGNIAKFRRPAREIPRLTWAKSSKFCGSPRPPIYDWKLFRNFSYWSLALY